MGSNRSMIETVSRAAKSDALLAEFLDEAKEFAHVFVHARKR
jgi:hypothetical protein